MFNLFTAPTLSLFPHHRNLQEMKLLPLNKNYSSNKEKKKVNCDFIEKKKEKNMESLQVNLFIIQKCLNRLKSN